ncbi:uncharacterized protein LOC133885536 [Phragmites australis]|uniref:uncharacterized protein LOC133885536 n=1 Tax=Phragmites australis TaxID=29695 RepID=UPI002D7753BC|nr:uncharacterized protein LOC133885536 [Phragmites australis]
MAVDPHRLTWEVAPVEDERMHPVLNRIDNLLRAGLTSVMVVADYLRRRLVPLRERAQFAWMYMGPNDITRTHIGAEGDLEEGALATLLRVVTGVEDLTRAVLPQEQLVLCTDLGWVALDGRRTADRRWGRRGRQAADRCRGAASGRQQAGRRDAASSSHQAGSRGTAGSGAEAPGDKGKRTRSFVPQPSSSSSPSPPRQLPATGDAKEGARGGQSSGAESGTEARSRAREPEDQGRASGATVGARADLPPEAGSTATPQPPGGQRPPPKRRKADPGPKPQGPDFRIPESRWQYREPKSMPPKDPAGGQRQPEELRSAPVLGPSAPTPEPSALVDPEPQAPPCPEPRAAAAPEQPAPSEPAPSTLRAEQVAAVEVVAARAALMWQLSETPSASAEKACRGPST